MSNLLYQTKSDIPKVEALSHNFLMFIKVALPVL